MHLCFPEKLKHIVLLRIVLGVQISTTVLQTNKRTVFQISNNHHPMKIALLGIVTVFCLFQLTTQEKNPIK